MGKSTELKALANLAKQRLKNASYSDEKYTTVNNINRNSYFYKNLVSLRRVSGGVEFVSITNNEDSSFLQKVYDLLSAEEDIYDPIGRLTDYDEFQKLDDNGKQFYVFNIVDRYARARDAYYSSPYKKKR